MLGKITKRTVDALAPGATMWDAGHREVVKGFGVRRQGDHIAYRLRYRVGGKQKIMDFGTHGAPWTPDSARAEAKRLLGLVVTGVDPIAERKERRAAERDAAAPTDSFGAVLAPYLERRRAVMKPRSFEEVERHLRAHAEPLHRLRLSEINRRAIAQRLSEIETGSGPVARNRVRSSLSAFFGLAVREGLLEVNPVAGTGKADEGLSRDRVLTNAELGEVWRALPEDQFGDIVRLLALTGQRREEIGGLCWSEVDFGRRLLALPPTRTKNSRPHEVPLAPKAWAILERQPRRHGRDLIFGIGDGPFSGWSDCKARLDASVNATRPKPMPAWRLHDLRRTAATGMAELGVLPHIIEAVLNHVSGHKAGVAGIYNRATHAEPMRDALDRWASHVAALVSDPAPALATAQAAPPTQAGPRPRLTLVRKQTQGTGRP